MVLNKLGEVKAVAFDIDGTLYKEPFFYFLIFPHFVLHIVFFSHFGLVRKKLREKDYYEDFSGTQAELMAERLHCSKEKALYKLDRIVYTGLEKYFRIIKPCKGAKEFIIKLKENGMKIALLSDFPPEQKGDIWGIKEYCDCCLGSEDIGALKPSSHVFTELQKHLDVAPEEILYIGNNHKYDVVGPKQVGMKAAWFVPRSILRRRKQSDVADITFSSYRELSKLLFDKD